MRRWLRVVLVTASGLLVGVETHAQITGPLREGFIKNASASCVAAVRKDNAALPEASAQTYCVCMATAQADITTPDDVTYVNEHNAASDDYRRRLQPLAARCSASAGI
jgi:hypothetical protein